MSVSFAPMLDFDFLELTDLFSRCFEGYLIPVRLTPEAVAIRSRRESIDHARSFVTLLEGEPSALAFAAVRFEAIRLAGMGVIHSARGKGIGRGTVAEFLRRARADSFMEAVLEVFEQNAPALALYRSFGFSETGRLYGFTREPFQATSAPAQEVSLAEYVVALNECEEPLPFIQTPEQAANMSLPLRCWTVNRNAFLVFAPPAPGQPIVVSGFVARPPARREGNARALFEAAQAAFPGHRWLLPQIFPESVAPGLEALGFERQELNQFEMRLRLDSRNNPNPHSVS